MAEAPRTIDTDKLAGWLATAIGAERVTITAAERLAGGAVQENWRLDVQVAGGGREGRHAWALRCDAKAQTGYSLDRATEFAVLKAAHAANVRVAEPIALCTEKTVLGTPFLIQQLMPGSAQARRLVRDPELAAFGEALAEDLGRQLAAVHKIMPPRPELSALPIPMLPPARAEVARLRAALDGASEARPALEYILVWLDRNAPATERLCLVHGDYRTGNYLVDHGRMTAILDWEFAHWGDTREDIGWLTARCWRFGNDEKQVGGVGSLAALQRGYVAGGGQPIEAGAIAYWQILAAARWAVIAVLQGDRFRKGGEQSIEAALTGLMAPEIELEALDGILALAKDVRP